MEKEKRSCMNYVVYGVVIIFIAFGLLYLLNSGSLDRIIGLRSFSSEDLLRPFTDGVNNLGDGISDLYSGMFR